LKKRLQPSKSSNIASSHQIVVAQDPKKDQNVVEDRTLEGDILKIDMTV
jgi:hypothetical protein